MYRRFFFNIYSDVTSESMTAGKSGFEKKVHILLMCCFFYRKYYKTLNTYEHQLKFEPGLFTLGYQKSHYFMLLTLQSPGFERNEESQFLFCDCLQFQTSSIMY